MGTIYTSICSRNTAYWNMVTAFQIAASHVGTNRGHMCKLAPYVGDSLISRARCVAMANFLRSNDDYLLSLDDDISLPPDGITKLIDADKDIIGGIYRLKGDKPKINPYAIRFPPKAVNIKFDDIVEVTYVSTGCVLFKRSFIEQLVSEYPDLWFWENMTENKVPGLYIPYIYKEEYLSEDWALCQRAADKGHKIWLHAGVQCDHWGLYGYKVSDLTLEQKEIQ